MFNDPLGGMPISQVYRVALDNIRKRIEESGEVYRQDKAVRILAEMHTENIKDLIDENMTDYDTRKLMTIVERCVARYVELEE